MIAIYLLAIVAANVSAALLGPGITILNAFLLIGLDLTVRDVLHARWAAEGFQRLDRSRLPVRMGALIVAGGALSYIATPGAGPIAVASALSWAAASAVDALVFHIVAAHGRRPHPVRGVMASNVAGAAVDSLLFPTLAFGALLWPVILGQFVAKVLGGTVWLVVIRHLQLRRERAAA